MKLTACLIYLVTLVIYFYLGDSSIYWGGFNMITQLLFTMVLCLIILTPKPNTLSERYHLEYVIVLTAFRIIYTALCIPMASLAKYNSYIFIIILIISYQLMLLAFVYPALYKKWGYFR